MPATYYAYVRTVVPRGNHLRDGPTRLGNPEVLQTLKALQQAAQSLKFGCAGQCLCDHVSAQPDNSAADPPPG